MLKWKSQKQHDSFELTLAESWAPWLRNSPKHWWAWKSKPFDNLLKAMVKSYRGRKSKTSMEYLTTQIFPTFLDRVRFQTFSLKERTQGMYLFPCVLDVYTLLSYQNKAYQQYSVYSQICDVCYVYKGLLMFVQLIDITSVQKPNSFQWFID